MFQMGGLVGHLLSFFWLSFLLLALLLVGGIKASVLMMFFQGLFFSLFHLLVVWNYLSFQYSKCQYQLGGSSGYFSLYNNQVREYFIFYYCCEGVFDFAFIVFYVSNMDFCLEVVFMFKQGFFPFCFYNCLFVKACFHFTCNSVVFIFLLIVSKAWLVILVGKVGMCLEIYFFYFVFSVWYLNNLSLGGVLETYGFVGSIVVLSNVFSLMFCSGFGVTFMVIYEGVGMWFLYEVLKMPSSSSLLKYSGLFLIFYSGGLVSFLSVVKIISLLELLEYSHFMFVCMTVFSCLVMFYVLMVFYNFMFYGGGVSGVVYNLSIIFLFMVWVVFFWVLLSQMYGQMVLYFF